jgi:hypothetical protein
VFITAISLCTSGWRVFGSQRLNHGQVVPRVNQGQLSGRTGALRIGFGGGEGSLGGVRRCRCHRGRISLSLSQCDFSIDL